MDLGSIDTTSYRDPSLGATIDSQVGKSNADIGRSYTSGNQEARGLLNDPGQLNKSLGFNDQAMGDAIRSKYMQGYGHKESQLNNKMFQQADADHIRQLAGASELANQEVEMNRQKEILRWKVQQSKKAQRGAILGNVLGIAGAAGGAYAGGPQGMMAGMQGGQAAGNMIGSS